MPELPFPSPCLKDREVALRPWRRADTPRRYAGFSDPLCLRFSWPLAEPFTEAHLTDRFDAQEDARRNGDELNLAVVDAADLDRLWGGASVYDIDLEEQTAGVGYWLAAAARGPEPLLITVEVVHLGERAIPPRSRR